ncbi:hypothetical protein JCM3775_002373 [Rhodotorula graminis]|uniref:C3H1-type domain-containing protein n=1 Tax=Rhodotorula graminis (strain WP1) TaxID=578459 RepID=A0A194S9I2_RHOGW|nr:uncharacterized protein RHOBADRAFT_64883 [Rhodotorula graminis WP1]KPV76056.1 hypothetical protein RHOBADRAFT_64883 [Rhodotorula graminis WP1]
MLPADASYFSFFANPDPTTRQGAPSSSSTASFYSPALISPVLGAFRRDSSDSSWSGSTSTTPSSIASCSSAFAPIGTSTSASAGAGTGSSALVDALLKERREADVALAAWRVRCETLEEEVGRLAVALDRVERERDEARTRGGAELLEGRVQIVASLSQARRLLHLPRPPHARPAPIINPDVPMSKQLVPPCNAHYLKGLCDVPRCRYEHRYELSPEQVDEMRRGAKHHVCNAIKHGLQCPDGDDCIFGHFCPRGPSCGRERCGFSSEQHLFVPPCRLGPCGR